MNIDDRIKVVRQGTESLGIVWTDDCENLVRRIINNRESRAILEARSEHCKEFMTTQKHIKDIIGLDPIATKAFAEVFTPKKLVDEMLDKLPKEVWSNPNFKWIDNAVGTGVFLWHGIIPRLMVGLSTNIPDEKDRKKHIASMIYGVDIQILNVGLCRTYLVKILGKDNLNMIKQNVVCKNSLEFDYWNSTKFDVVVGNPPYQDSSGNKGKGHTLWTEFVKKAFCLLNDNGYLVYVHPAVWRQVDHPLGKFMKSKDIMYLEIHNDRDGMSTFGANTRYDWYVIHNCENKGKTVIKGEDGIEEIVNISTMRFVPNMMFGVVSSLIGYPSVTFIHSESDYEARKKWMRKEKNKDYKYPCVYGISTKNEATCTWSNTTERGHFGIPKFIFHHAFNTGCIVDEIGEYGVSQWASAIVDEKENLLNIKKAFTSQKFHKIIDATALKREINWKIINLFRKDFWKEFV